MSDLGGTGEPWDVLAALACQEHPSVLKDDNRLFCQNLPSLPANGGRSIPTEKLTRLDLGGMKEKLLPFCRLKHGEIWEDPIKGHRVGVLDATNYGDVERIMGDERIKFLPVLRR